MNKTTVVLFHAFPLSKKMWGPQLKGLSAAVRWVAIDLPGFGKGKRMAGKPSIAGMARAAAAELDRLGIQGPAMVAGISMGGYVALEFARTYPRRVSALGLFSTRSGPDTLEQKAKRRQLAPKVVKEGMKLLVQKSAPALLGKTTHKQNPALLRSIARIMRRNDPRGSADALLAMAGRRDRSAVLARLDRPVLIIAGREDGVISPDESRAMGRLARASEVHVLPAAGHLVNLEQPARFNRILERFVSGLRARTNRRR